VTVSIEYITTDKTLTENFTTQLTELLDSLLQDSDLGWGEVNVVVGDDEMLQNLNREYRSKDAPTDVLSFSYIEGEEDIDSDDPDFAVGDIFVSLDKAALQAESAGHSTARELAFLAVHGMLHLLGYDHIEDNEAALMRKKELAVMEIFDERINRS
jgi:probable rRNA maturation factor